MTNHAEVNLFETGQAPTIQNVRVGDKIKIEEKYGDSDETRMVTWTVQKVYSHLVYATVGSRHKCFDYGTLVQLGLESKYTQNYRGGKGGMIYG